MTGGPVGWKYGRWYAHGSGAVRWRIPLAVLVFAQDVVGVLPGDEAPLMVVES